MHVRNSRRIEADPYLKVETFLTNGLKDSPFFVSLAHELGHSFGLQNGRGNTDFWMKINQKNVTQHEKYASLIENKIRNEHGLNLRTHYSHTRYDDGSVDPLKSTMFFQSNNVNAYLQGADNFNLFMFRMLSFQFNMNQANNSCNCK